MTLRNQFKSKSNNKDNTNQNICTRAVTDYFKTGDTTRYLHTIHDVVSSIRNSHTVRSRSSQVKGLTIGKARTKLRNLTDKEQLNPKGYIIQVPGHAMLLNPIGETLVDTAPRKKDKRRILTCHIVY